MASDSLLGKTLDEYRIEKQLGVGGMAKVYRALDTKLQRYVALKVIAPDFRADSEYARRFEREAQSIARLEHPNIVQIYRFGEVDGLYYMAMQYIDGADLSWLIRDYKDSGEVMSLGDVVQVMQAVGAALDYAHSRDVIHRDVKPGNIMVDNLGRTLLTDFGLALLGDVGTRGEIFGSPHYIAPEQAISSANVVPQSDQYSLGITLFEMLTGELPFTGGEPLELSMRHLSEMPPAPSQFNGAVPASVDEVVLRALEKEPSDRYQNCAELAAALKTAVEQTHPAPPAADTPIRRPSLVLVPQKVYSRLQTVPLPETKLSPTPPAVQPTAEVPMMPQAKTIRAQLPRSNPWMGAILFAAVLFVIGIIFIFLLLRSRQQAGSVEALPPPTVLAAAQATEVPSLTPSSIPTTLAPPTTIPIAILPTLVTTMGALPIATTPEAAQTTEAPSLASNPIPTTLASSTPIPMVVILPKDVGAQPLATIMALVRTMEAPSPTPSPVPATPTPTPASATPAPHQYTLVIARKTDQSLYVFNISPDPFPLSGLRLGGDRGIVTGDEWQVDHLNNGECVSIWKDVRNAKAPDVTCSVVGVHLTRSGHDVFWKSRFTIYYNETEIDTCDKDKCTVSISAP